MLGGWPRPMIKKVSTFIEGFDEALGGGIPKGNVVLVSGTPGTMKSSLCFSILYENVKHRGSKGLYISLEESHDDLKASMEELGMRGLDSIELHLLDVGKIRQEHREEEANRDWMEILQTYIEQRVKGQGLDLVVVDSLAALYSLSHLENPRRQLFHFISFLKDLGATTFLISEMRAGEPRYAQYDEDFLADGILYVKQWEVGDSDVQLRLRCVKMRRTRHAHGYFALIRTDDRFLVTSIISEAAN